MQNPEKKDMGKGDFSACQWIMAGTLLGIHAISINRSERDIPRSSDLSSILFITLTRKNDEGMGIITSPNSSSGRYIHSFPPRISYVQLRRNGCFNRDGGRRMVPRDGHEIGIVETLGVERLDRGWNWIL